MFKAGVIDEMMDDAMDVGDSVGMEEDTDAEVNRVLAEIAGETAAQLPEAGRASVVSADATMMPHQRRVCGAASTTQGFRGTPIQASVHPAFGFGLRASQSHAPDMCF
jgi:hypothetical protein